MTEAIFPPLPNLCDLWSRTLSLTLEAHWKIWDTHYKNGMDLLEVWKGPETSTSAPRESASLLPQALRRVSQGFAPPREVYDLPTRNRVDWSSFPEWARPADPEMFDGNAHEG